MKGDVQWDGECTRCKLRFMGDDLAPQTPPPPFPAYHSVVLFITRCFNRHWWYSCAAAYTTTSMSQLGLLVWNKPACTHVHVPSLKDIEGRTKIQNKLCSVTWICKRLTFTSFDGTELCMSYFQALSSLWKTVVSHLNRCLLLGDCCNKF